MSIANSMFEPKVCAVWLFSLMLMTGPALAIEKYDAVPLSDDDRGSTAKALVKVGAGTLAVVGSKLKADGTIGAMYWSIAVDPSDPSGNTVVATELPKPAGMSAGATGLAFLGSDPDQPIISGFFGTDTAGTQAVIWRRDSSGNFTNTILDDAPAVANAVITRNTPLGLIIVVCGRCRLVDGSWHACLWRVGPAGIARTDLGTLGGANSEATAIANIDDLIGWNIVGRAERPNGRTLATAWIVRLTGGGDLDWFLRALPTPAGAQSHVVYVSGTNGGVWKTTGWIREPNGRTSASLWVNRGETRSTFLSALYQDVLGRTGNSTANGLISSHDDDILIAGVVRTSAGARGIAALPFNQSFNAPFPFDVLRSTDTVLDWNSIALNAVDPGGALAGEGLIAGSTMPQAMLFRPITVEVPQSFHLMVGNGFGDVLFLWQQDGRALALRSRRVGEVESILAEWTSTRQAAVGSSTAPRRLILVSRLIPRNANATPSAMLTLQLYDSAAGQWVDVATRPLMADGLFHRLAIDIPDPSPFAVSQGEPLRWRPALRGEDWRDWEVDLMEMEIASLP